MTEATQWMQAAHTTPATRTTPATQTTQATHDTQPDLRFRQPEKKAGVDPEGAFWRRHVRIGVSIFVVGGFAVLAYALTTPNGRNRPALVGIDSACIVLWVAILRPIGLKLVATGYRESFFFVWSTLTAMFIATAAALDGGTHSPLSYLLVLPVLFGGLAYKPKVVIWLVVVDVACAAAAAFATPDRQTSAIAVLVLAVAIAGMLNIGGAFNRERLNQKLVDQAAQDSLTGCLAYRAFHNRLDEEVERAKRYGRSFGLVMVDVDNLKKLNDSAGHSAGDEALLMVSSRLLYAARASDVVGRLGGDEFAVLLPETEASQLDAVVDRLRAELYRFDVPLPTTLSFGSTVWGGPSDFSQDMLRRADEALYAAKHTGRNRTVAWEPSIVHLRAASGVSTPSTQNNQTPQPTPVEV
ncbi:MAG: GGDEF domain-containing protein [Acidimicrobiales bacterium]